MTDRDPQPCRVIGVLDDGVASLNPTALAHLRNADLVIGGARALALFEAHIAPDAVRRDLTGQLSAVPEWIRSAREAQQRSVVLATGDPLCHGIASYLASRLCIEAIEVLPNVSTLQLACARVGLAWQDAKIVSIHAKDAGEWRQGAAPSHGLYPLAQALRQHDRLAVLTSPHNTPDRIARLLLASGARRLVVCDIGGVVHPGRPGLDPDRVWLADHTDPDGLTGSLREALVGADVFIGVSAPGILTGDDIATMAAGAVVFALANPDPEVDPAQARRTAAVVATGRSDEPNQINNVLVFPGVFRGLLDAGARHVDLSMEAAAARALADVVTPSELNAAYIVPSVFDPAVTKAVAAAVRAAATPA